MTATAKLTASLAFLLVPDWRWRWLRSPYPWAAVLVAAIVFSPVLIWNCQHDWASFRFQFVRAVAAHPLSMRTVGEFIGLQLGLVGFVLLPVVISGVALTAWRGYRHREPVAILLSTAVIVPFADGSQGEVCVKSLVQSHVIVDLADAESELTRAALALLD